MDEQSLRKQLEEAEEALRKEPSSLAFKELRDTLKEALLLAQQDEDDEDDEESSSEEEGEGEGEGDEKRGQGDGKGCQVDEKRGQGGEKRWQVDGKGSQVKVDCPPEEREESVAKEVQKRSLKTVAEAMESIPQKRQKMASENPEMEEIPLGSRCEVYEDGKDVWQAAVLQSYENAEGLVAAKLVHSGEDITTKAARVRPIKQKYKFDRTKVQIGMTCKARFSSDGKWYPAIIMQVTSNGCVVQYDKYKNQEEVAFEHLEVKLEEQQTGAASGPGVVAQVPKHLQVKETDPDTVKRKKKKTLEKLKRETKHAQAELMLDKKKQGWQSFQAKNKSKRK